MKIPSPPSLLEKMNFWLFLFLLFAFQVIFIFQGIDLSDSGFYATFYQQIYHAPETAQYNFMFWFSGIVGGAVSWLFPDLGLWGIRFAGVIVTTSTILVTYQLLKRYLDRGSLMLGLLIALLFINNNLKEVHYNDLSALLDMLAIAFLFRGLRDNRNTYLFISGLFISLSTFTRLPNILCLGLGAGIIYYGYHVKTRVNRQILQLFLFGLGFVVTSGIVLLFMKMIGHLEIFVNSVKLLSSMGKGGDESFYGPSVLVRNFVNTYVASIKYTLMIIGASLAGAVIISFAKRYSFYRSWLGYAIKYAIILFICAALVAGKIEKETILFFVTGLILVITALIVFTRGSVETKLLALMGCYILLTYPFSSSAGLFTVGIYSVWLSLPIVIDYLFRIQAVESSFSFSGSNLGGATKLSIPQSQINQVRNWMAVILVVGCLVYTWRYPFFDRHERTRMTASIDNKYLRGILTTPERATALNEMLAAAARYTHPDDYLIAYQCIPMINYATATRPYMRNSYPWLYEAETFRQELYKGYEETKKLPIVIMQKIKTTGLSSNWPDPTPEDIGSYIKKNEKRDTYFDAFLQEHHYREVWSSAYFRILLPAQ